MSIFNPQPKDSDERKAVKDVQKGKPTLLDMKDERAAKIIKQRYQRFKRSMEKLQAELKVNNLRWDGYPWAQIDPLDHREVYIPTAQVGRKLPPVLNKIQRANDRYTAQIWADQPILEGVPSSHEDEDRDAAEASSHVLAGEWERARLKHVLMRAGDLSGINRSSFVLAEWDSTAGGMVPAQKFFPVQDAKGKPVQELHYVDKTGQPVEDQEMAAKIWEGNLTYKIGTPLNVRYSGHRNAHQATEVFWAELKPLREVFDLWPGLKKHEIRELLVDVPPEAEQWLQDLRGESDLILREHDEDDLDLSGDDLVEGDRESLLDENCMVIHYFHKQNRQYKAGAHLTMVGKRIAYRGALRWELDGKYLIPVAQYRCLDHPKDKYGRALVDVLKDPQQLLDFVNASVLSLLRATSRARYFLQHGGSARPHELLDPDEAVIWYNGDKAPIREQPGELSRTLVDFVDRFRADFDDMSGIHETMQGKHVPGVSSGRHAEALRSGDETLMGLTREQVEDGLVALGRVILAAVRREWKRPRRVRYLGQDRKYVEKHFTGADIGNVADVVLKKGTLLMLTPQQKTETLYGLAQMGILMPPELRKLSPVTDVAGVSLSQDPHYIRARRLVDDFVQGPPQELMMMFQQTQQQAQGLEQQVSSANSLLDNVSPEAGQILAEKVGMLAQQNEQLDMQWQMELQKYMPAPEITDQDPMIASVIYEEFAAALARERVEQFPQWWVEPFRQYTMQLGMTAQRIPPPMMPGMPVEEGAPQEGAQPVADEAAPPTGGAEMFEPHETGVVP